MCNLSCHYFWITAERNLQEQRIFGEPGSCTVAVRELSQADLYLDEVLSREVFRSPADTKQGGVSIPRNQTTDKSRFGELLFATCDERNIGCGPAVQML